MFHRCMVADPAGLALILVKPISDAQGPLPEGHIRVV